VGGFGSPLAFVFFRRRCNYNGTIQVHIQIKGETMMIVTALDLVAITIAMASSITVMILFWRQNMALQRDNINLRRLLRVEREKNVIRN